MFCLCLYEEALVLMLHFYETNKLGIWNMEMVFLLKKKNNK